MKLGLVADVHEEVEKLEQALAWFGDDVDQVVFLGDVFEGGRRVDEAVRVLRSAGAVGVYGNHELALCHDPNPDLQAKYDPATVEFFAALPPHLEIDGILVSHGMAHWDATDGASYYLEDKPWMPGAMEPLFETFGQRLFLMGHHHCWFVGTPSGALEWTGESPVEFDPRERYHVVVHAVQNGWCGTLDTTQNVLTPHYFD